MATSILAIAATVVVPTISQPVDLLSAAARTLRADHALARQLAIIHNAECTVALDADAGGYRLTATDPDVLDSLAAANPDAATDFVRRIAADGQTLQGGCSIDAAGDNGTGPTNSWTFLPSGRLSGRIDSVVVMLRSGGRRLPLTVDFRTGLASIQGQPVADTGGGSS